MTLKYWFGAELSTTIQENLRPGAIKNSRDFLPNCLPNRCFCSDVYIPSHSGGWCSSSLPPSSLVSPSSLNISVTSSHRGAPTTVFSGWCSFTQVLASVGKVIRSHCSMMTSSTPFWGTLAPPTGQSPDRASPLSDEETARVSDRRLYNCTGVLHSQEPREQTAPKSRVWTVLLSRLSRNTSHPCLHLSPQQAAGGSKYLFPITTMGRKHQCQ